MAIEIFKLMGSILVNNDAANESISKTDEKAEGLGNKFLKGVGTAAKWGTAVVGAAAAGGAALFGMATKSAEVTDRIDKLSNKIGISKQGFQEWDYILGQNGMDVEKLQVGVKTLVSQMDAAAGGSKNATESFNKLGLSWEDGNGKLKNQETMMNEAMLALADMENGTEKARLATELFGKAGVEMMPMLNNGAEGIEELRSRAHDLGLVLGDDAVNAGVVLGDTIDDVKDSFGMIATKIGVGVMPLVQKFLDFILEKMPIIQEVLSIVFKGIEMFVSGVVNVISSIFSNMEIDYSSFLDTLKSLWETYGKPIFEAFSSVFQTVYDNAQPIMQGIQTLFGIVMDYIATVWESIGRPVWSFFVEAIEKLAEVFNHIFPILVDIFSGICDTLKNLWESILKPLFEVIGAFIEYVLLPKWSSGFSNIGEIVKMIFSFIGTLWNTVLKPILDGIINFVGGIFSGNWSQVWKGITQILSGIWGAIKTLLWSPIEWVIGKISGIVENIVSPFRQAAKSIGDVWSSIRSLFKLPHFTINGSLNPLKWIDEGMPKIGVDWYYKGGIFTKPTVLPGGIGVGDKFNGKGSNAEAVIPLDSMYENIKSIVADENKNNKGGLTLIIENFINNREQDVEELMEEIAFFLKRKGIVT